MGESFRQIPEDYREPNEHDRGLENGQGLIEFVSASVKKRNRFNKELGPVIGITDTDNLAKLRRKLQEELTIPQLNGNTLDLETVNFLRNRYGFDALGQEEYEVQQSQTQEVENSVEQLAPEEKISLNSLNSEQTQIVEEETGITPEIPAEQELVSEVLSPIQDQQDQITPIAEESILQNPEQVAPKEELTSENPDVQGMLAEVTAIVEAEQQEEEKLDVPEGGENKGEETERLTQEARETIAIYQKFGQEHPIFTRDQATQERYRQLEAEAWGAQNRLAHMNGGEIFALPQKRDIELSHPEAKDTKDYLESLEYGFDEKGNIITIKHHNKNIELNRPYSVANLIDKARPAQILTDINLDNIDTDLHRIGYVLPGLNPQTPDFIVSTLSKDEFIQGVIVDDIVPEQVVTPEANPEIQASSVLFPPEPTAEQLPITPVPEVNLEVENSTLEVVISPEIEQAPINPDLGSLYYQEIQLWNNIQALKERREQKEAKEEDIDTQIEKAESDYQSFINTLWGSELGRRFVQFLDLRTESAYTEEQNNKYGRDKGLLEKIRDKFSREDVSDTEELSPKDQELKARNEYNQALQELIRTESAIGLESEIQTLFATEVQRLRDERIVQSQELQEWDQTGLEKIANSTKEKLFNWYIKHKNTIGKVNLALFATSTTLALTGAGLPVAGALEAVRRTIAYPMAFASGVSSRELIRSKFEDGDVNILNIIKYKGGITKLVGESLQGNYIQEAQDTELTAKLSTLESYYRLNGGKFTELSQQKAYELILTELGQRVENQKIDDVKPDIEQPEEQETTANTGLDYNINLKDNPIEQNPNYVNSLLETVSEKRITELQRLQRNRTIANVAGTVVAGSLLVNLAAHAIKLDKPDIADTPDNLSVGTSPETATPNPTEISPVKPDIPSSEGAESMNEVAKEATQQLSTEQLQDISELSKGETLWGEIAKKLGANASEAQIQQGVETYMQSTQGSETIFNLANQTEGGRALLSQWGIDNAGELSQVSKTDLYELSRHLGVGQLKGLDTLDITNLPPLDEVSTPTGLTPPESPSSGVTPPGPGAESIPPTDTNTFAREVSHTLRLENTSLDDNQVKDILEAYHSTEQGRNSMYELILSAPEGDTYLSNLGIKTIEDFSNLSEDQLYELSQSIDLNKLEGFNFNNIILSRFEDAPNSIPLIKGTGALSQVNQYIDLYAGALPYNSTLGQEVLTTYLNTPEGKDWLYDAIVNNPDTLNGNQGIQIAKEYFRQKGIQQGTDIDWTLLSGDKKNPTSIFWRETSLTGGRKIPPLSTLLKPGTMPGIKKALEQVLTLKQ